MVGPQLFSIYINDIVNQVKTSKIQMYVDDIVLYNDIDNNIDAYRQNLENVVNWCKGNELTMNIDKAKYQILPTGKQVDVEHLDYRFQSQIGSEPLKHVKQYKYFAVEIDNLLTMKQHAKNINIHVAPH